MVDGSQFFYLYLARNAVGVIPNSLENVLLKKLASVKQQRYAIRVIESSVEDKRCFATASRLLLIKSPIVTPTFSLKVRQR
jgi:hypothetical protein